MESIRTNFFNGTLEKSSKSSPGYFRSGKNKAVNYKSLESFVYKWTIADEGFKESSKTLLSVIYRTLDAVAPFELDHFGPVTIGLLELFCNRSGLENLKKMVDDSIVTYRREIYENLNRTSSFSDTVSYTHLTLPTNREV